jgi:hypothetical protein
MVLLPYIVSKRGEGRNPPQIAPPLVQGVFIPLRAQAKPLAGMLQ